MAHREQIMNELQEAKRLLKSCLKEFRYGLEGDYMVDDEWRKGYNECKPTPRKIKFTGKYWPGDSKGKLLNKIDNFLATTALNK